MILARAAGTGKADKTPIGYLPTKDAIDLSGLNLSDEAMDQLLSVKNEEWSGELDGVKTFFERFGAKFPKELWTQFDALKDRLKSKVAA